MTGIWNIVKPYIEAWKSQRTINTKYCSPVSGNNTVLVSQTSVCLLFILNNEMQISDNQIFWLLKLISVLI